MNTDVNPYAILGVARDCSSDELKSAYRRLARENHPDIAQDKEAATSRMTQINAAWSLIGDPQKRVGYDLRWRLEERERAAKSSPPRTPVTPSSQTAPSSRRPKTARPPASSTKAPPHERSTQTPNAPSPNGAKNTARRASPSVSRHARLAEASRLLFKQNKPNETITLCRSILKTDFRNIPARELMGEAYLRLGQIDRALAVWEQALVLAPGNITLRRRWLGLMTPETRAAQERKIPSPTVVPPRAAPVSSSSSPTRPRSNSQRGLVGRLLARLGGRR